LRTAIRNPVSQHHAANNVRTSESPRPTPAPESRERRKRVTKEKEPDAPIVSAQVQDVPPKKRKRTTAKRAREDILQPETPKPFAADRAPVHTPGPGSFKLSYGHAKDSAETASSGSGTSGRSVQPSPTSATPRPPSRVFDENYDEGIAETLMGLASYKAPEAGHAANTHDPTHSPAISSGSLRHRDVSPRRSHRGSVSSSRSRASPPVSLKRPLSLGPDDPSDNKRSRMDMSKRRSPSGGRRTPLPSTRPSPIPFRPQPASHSPEARQTTDLYPPSSPLPAVLPPHPRPVGAGLSHVSNPSVISFPPIATLSPTSSAPSPVTVADSRDERMRVDNSRSLSPPSRLKLTEMVRPSRTPPKHTPTPPLKSHSEKMDTTS
jgi:hypothetical protein